MTGQPQPGGSGVTVPTALLNTLADILAACVNTTGSGSPACGTLLASAGSGTATDTIGAMLGIVGAPATNVQALFGLVTATAPFVPALASAPGSLVVPVSYTLLTTGGGGSTPGYLLAIDSTAHLGLHTQWSN